MIQNLDELEKLLKILRSQSISSFKWNGLEISLNDLPLPLSIDLNKDVSNDPQYPSQTELDAAVGLPVGGLDDPFLYYNEPSINTDEDSKAEA